MRRPPQSTQRLLGSSRWLGLAAALVTSASASTDAAAAEAEAPPEAAKPRVQLDSVRAVTLQRSSAFDSPRAVSAIENDELRASTPRSVGDALRDEEGVFVQQPSYSMQSPNLRGLGDGRVEILVDGIRLNNTITSTIPGGLTNLNLVDPYTVSGIEVLRGPGLSTYGDGGLGGAIYLRTMHPTPIAGSNVELSAGARGLFSSPDQGIQGSIYGGGRWNRFALETAFSARRFRDLTGGSQGGTQPFTGYTEGGLYVGAGADLGRGSVIIVFQGVRQYDAIRSERSQPGDIYTMPDVGRDLAYLRYDGDFELRGRPVTVSSTLSFQRQSESANRQELAYDSLLHLQNRADVMGVQVRARTDLGRAGSLAMGLDGAFEWVDSTASRGFLHEGGSGSAKDSPAEARYPGDGRSQTVSVFLQDEIDLERLFVGREGDRPGRVRALIGARAGANFLHIGRDDRLQQLLSGLLSEALPERQLSSPVYGSSLHLRYELYPGFALSVGGMTGVRVPNLDDQTRLDAGRPGLLVPTRTPLRSESAYSGEIGLRTAYRRLEGSAYYSFAYLDSPLSVVPTTVGGQGCHIGQDTATCERFLTRANADSLFLHTVEANLRVYMFWGLSLFSTVAYTYAVSAVDSASSASPLGRIPPVHGIAALEFRRPRTVFSFAQLIMRWGGPQRRLAPEDLFDPTICLPAVPAGSCTGTPGYLVLSVRSVLQLTRQIYLSGVFDNLTNDSYRFHGSGVDGPGLGVHLAVEGNY